MGKGIKLFITAFFVLFGWFAYSRNGMLSSNVAMKLPEKVQRHDGLMKVTGIDKYNLYEIRQEELSDVLNQSVEKGYYESLNLYNNGNLYSNVFFDENEKKCYYPMNDGFYWMPSTVNEKPSDMEESKISDLKSCPIPLGNDYYFLLGTEKLCDINGRTIDPNIVNADLTAKNYKTLLKKQHYGEISMRELSILLQGWSDANECIVGWFTTDGPVAYIKTLDENGHIVYTRYNLDTGEERSMNVDYGTEYIFTDCYDSHITYNKLNNTLTYEDYTTNKNYHLYEGEVGISKVNYSNCNGNFYMGIILEDGTFIVFNRNEEYLSRKNTGDININRIIFTDYGYIALDYSNESANMHYYKMDFPHSEG